MSPEIQWLAAARGASLIGPQSAKHRVSRVAGGSTTHSWAGSGAKAKERVPAVEDGVGRGRSVHVSLERPGSGIGLKKINVYPYND